MPVYSYQARNIQGTIINGTLDAQTREEVVNSLRQRDYFPLKIEVDKKERDINIDLFNKVTLKDLSLFCRQFAFVIQSGTPMLRAVELSMQQTEKKKMKEILGRVHEKIQRGRSFSDSLRFEEDIPDLMINMIEAGEASGKLDYIMNELSEYYKKQYKQKQKVAQSTLYPKIVIVFATVIVGFLLVYVVPDFANNLAAAGGELPIFTKLLISFGNLVSKIWIIILAALAGLYGFKKLVLDKDLNYRINSGKRSLNGRVFGSINR
ncbi:type II secretion system F family protein, partial [Clostridium sp. LY3-2]|uniref:type II secretion system F family protein n=1 Tax=Clostridium sp. LY3-2 TaxID=2942482 RepID=UPI002152363C